MNEMFLPNYEQAKSLSRETFRVKTAPFSIQAELGQVSITLMVAGWAFIKQPRLALGLGHYSALNIPTTTVIAIVCYFRTWTGNGLL